MPLMKPLSPKLACEIGPRLKDALDRVGACIDLLHADTTVSRATKTEWLLAIDRVQQPLCDLTLNANRCARK